MRILEGWVPCLAEAHEEDLIANSFLGGSWL